MTETKSIIIVGASSGIGEAIGRRFIDMGWKTGVAARRVDRLQHLVEMAPDRVVAQEIDVTMPDAGNKLISLIKKLGKVDVVLNVAGIGKQNPELDEEMEQRTIATNVAGFTRIVDTAFKYFADKSFAGQIAAITSIAGTKGLGMAASYSATKRYQNTYLESLEQLAHLRKLNIAFTDIRPGFVATDLLNDARKYPMLMNVENVADAAVKAIMSRRRVKVIDWRYALLTFFWSLIPRSIWRILPIKN